MSIEHIKKPLVAVDTVIFTVKDNDLYTLVIKRLHEPFKNQWTLVGGFIDIDKDESIEDTAKRKLAEKTGVLTPYVEQVETIGNATRDPRGWSMTTAYFALISSDNIELKSMKGAVDTKWTKISGNGISEKLAYDHEQILTNCLERLRSKVLYTTLPAYLLPDEFTISEMQKIYEIILGKVIDRKSFQRRMFKAGILEETGEMKESGRRPAKLYRLKEKNYTHYFLRNIEGAQ